MSLKVEPEVIHFYLLLVARALPFQALGTSLRWSLRLWMSQLELDSWNDLFLA